MCITDACEQRFKDYNTSLKDCLAWIEKQGERKPQGKTALETIKEKKVDNANKVEPKFKVDDWVTDGINNYLIQGKAEKAYVTATIDGEVGCILFDNVNQFRLWAIEDAKDGDVLYSKEHNLLWIYKDKEAYHACINLNYGVPSSLGGVIVIPNDTCPATKEQRDLLFSKMKEEGYGWDADKKKVKIIDFSKHLKYEPNQPSIFKDGDFVEELAYKLQELLGGNAAGARYLAKDWAKDLLPLVK